MRSSTAESGWPSERWRMIWSRSFMWPPTVATTVLISCAVSGRSRAAAGRSSGGRDVSQSTSTSSSPEKAATSSELSAELSLSEVAAPTAGSVATVSATAARAALDRRASSELTGPARKPLRLTLRGKSTWMRWRRFRKDRTASSRSAKSAEQPMTTWARRWSVRYWVQSSSAWKLASLASPMMCTSSRQMRGGSVEGSPPVASSSASSTAKIDLMPL
mmetsp:Transcript_16087/g.60881  ORF Transcript_16087/g.60881 Transcript_16087/m.60881 type:complete len:218 (-) Transcript_16087:1296-1949(-)